MLTICGAGAVGLVMGGRLAGSGVPIRFATRTPEVADVLARDGVEIEDPISGERLVADVEAAPSAEAARLVGSGPVLFCTRSAHLIDAARALAPALQDCAVVCWLNDIDNEDRLAAYSAKVVGGVVRQTSTRTAANRAVATGRGRLILGDHPTGLSDASVRVADQLRGAGYDVSLSEHITEDKWLKLCINLMSAPNALIRRDDHETDAFVEVKARLLEEALEATSAAGVSVRSCDGADRSLDEEIVWQRESVARGTSARRLPIYNQVWAALRHGGSLEADDYHRRIIELGAAHGVATPTNARVLERLVAIHAARTGPESLAAESLLV